MSRVLVWAPLMEKRLSWRCYWSYTNVHRRPNDRFLTLRSRFAHFHGTPFDMTIDRTGRFLYVPKARAWSLCNQSCKRPATEISGRLSLRVAGPLNG